MTSEKFLLCVTLIIISYYGNSDALRCYVCNGCHTVSEEYIQTCAPRTTVVPSTESTTLAPQTPSTIAPTETDLSTTEVTPEDTTDAPEASNTTTTSTTTTTTTTTTTPTTTPTTTTTTERSPPPSITMPPGPPPVTIPSNQTDSPPDNTNSPPDNTNSTVTTNTLSTSQITDDTTSEPNVNKTIWAEFDPQYNVQMVHNVFNFSPARGKRETRDEDSSNMRCLVTFFEVNGQQNVVRGCSEASNDNEALCREAIGGDFDGSLQSWRKKQPLLSFLPVLLSTRSPAEDLRTDSVASRHS
ncbi:hypothetical protein evm_002998 [Chilo suppressalis]|nr:hypothetical protein evm_002998 [Chilo suppressalis]